MTFAPLAEPFAAGTCVDLLTRQRRMVTPGGIKATCIAWQAVNTGRAAAFIAASIARAARANTLVMARWESNDGTKQIVAKQPVRLGALLNGDWTPNGYTLVEWSVAL